MKNINKKTSEAFGKKVYLLGKLKTGEYIWLEEAKWDCGWYYGFGYIETYTNNENPNLSKDISSHSHWDSIIVGKQEKYNFEKQCWELSKEYIHHLNENPKIEESVLSDNESWELAELMEKFYILKNTSNLFYKGSAGVSSSEVTLKNLDLYNQINKEMMPKIFNRVYEILTPNN
mgnify:CR=1 FL=1